MEPDFWKKIGRPNLGQMDQNQAQNCNQFHNILRLFDVLPIFSFTTSETMDDYY